MNAPAGALDLSLLRARHHVVNALVRYLRAVDDKDIDGVLTELRHATVSFGGPAHFGIEELTNTYRSAFATSGRTRHLLHEVEVAWAGDAATVVGRAGYQRWSLDSDPPAVTALGQYRVVLDPAEDDRPRLVELTVDRDWQLG
jgi:hypothetical protein